MLVDWNVEIVRLRHMACSCAKTRRKPKPKVLFVDPGIPDITKMGPSIALNTWFVAHMS